MRETVGEKERNTPTSMDIDRKSPIISQKKKEKRKDTIKVPDTVELFKRATKRQKMTKNESQRKRRIKQQIIKALKAKALIDDNYIKTTVSLHCTNTDKNIEAFIHSCHLNEDKVASKHATFDNVIWELFIKKSEELFICITAKAFDDAIIANQEGSVFNCVIFDIIKEDIKVETIIKEEHENDNAHMEDTDESDKNKPLSSNYLNLFKKSCVKVTKITVAGISSQPYIEAFIDKKNPPTTINVVSLTVNNTKEDCFLETDLPFEEADKICSHCNVILPTQNFLERIANTSKFRYTYLESEDTIICKNCTEKVLQISKITTRNKLLEHYMATRILTFERRWNKDSMVLVNNTTILNALMNYPICDVDILHKLNKVVKVYTCNIQSKDNIKEYKNIYKSTERCRPFTN